MTDYKKYFAGKKIVVLLVLFGELVLAALANFVIVQAQSSNLLPAPLSLDEKVGQLFMVSIDAYEPDADTLDWLKSHHIGGVILLGKNVQSFAQTKRLTKLLQTGLGQPKRPLLIAVDQEGGAISRFNFTDPIAMKSQPDITSADEAYIVGKTRAQKLVDLGININFSPVLDIAQNPDQFIFGRAFRGDASQVSNLGLALIRGYRDGGVIPVAKHFPGHGMTATDSHKDLPVVYVSLGQLLYHLYPFWMAAKNNVEMLMMAHIKIPNIDSKYPASLSPLFVTSLLRKIVGYQGVIITDDLGMGAVTKSVSLPRAAKLAIAAGNDIVLSVRPLKDYEAMYTAIRSAIVNGEILESRLDESVTRILKLKEKIAVR